MKDIIASGKALGALAQKLQAEHDKFIKEVKRCAQNDIDKTFYMPTGEERVIKAEMKVICETLLKLLQS